MKQEVVTDHAVIRWLERVEGIDMKAIRKKILNTDVQSALKMKASSYTSEDMIYKFRNGRVITVIARGKRT